MEGRKKKKVAGQPTRTLDSVKDERFAHILKNPVYRPVPKKEKKVEIDKRFQAMFNDEKFKLKYKVDKRGRPVETTTDENLKRYYNLAGDEEDDDDDQDEDGSDDDDTDKKSSRKKSSPKDDDDDSSEDSDDSEGDENDDEEEQSDIEGNVKEAEIKAKEKKKLDEATRKKLHSTDIDYARGEANFADDSSSDDDSSTDDENDASMVHDWGELDKDASRTEDSSRRLALCNMDWDRVRAVDLMVLLGSFLPAGGVLKSVTIYPSEYGKERMAEEETQGPRELREVKKEPSSDNESESDDEEHSGTGSDEEDEEGEGSHYSREKLRQYQLNRLKYYYAVAEFDSPQTAEKVYSECDGMEYESSAAKVDLRFIPDELSFDEDTPKDQCTVVPDSSKYRPRFFTTTALQQVKVDLTWDETDPLRKELTEKIFDPKEKIDDDDIRAYLATSSESEEEEEDEANVEDEIKEEDISEEEDETPENKKITANYKKKESKKDTISKYKALLQSIESTEKKKKEKDMEMEITWGVGLKETTENLVKKKLEEEQKSKRTPWEEMLDKRKEKRQARKQERKRKATKSDDESDSNAEDSKDESGQMFSDDDVDVDMSDEFFQSEFRDNEIFKQGGVPKSKKDKDKKKKDSVSEEDHKKKGKTAAELELLLMDEDDNKRHFSLKKIIDEENETKSKKKRKNKKKFKRNEDTKDEKRTDDFEINVEDNRFGALFNSHHFNIDPSDPNFKKTKAMEKIISEKHRRRAAIGNGELNGGEEESDDIRESNNKIAANSANDSKGDIRKKAELSFLVKSIKRNTENLKSKKKKKY